MNTDEHDFQAVIAEADPRGEGGAWLRSVGQQVVGGFLSVFFNVNSVSTV